MPRRNGALEQMVATPTTGPLSQPDYLQITMLDGGRVSLESPWPIGPTSITGTARRESGQERVLLVSRPPTAEDLAKDLVVTSTGIRFHLRYETSGGDLRLGSGNQPESEGHVVAFEKGPDGVVRPKLVHMAIWAGAVFTLHTFQNGGEVDALREFFESISIIETVSGIKVTPRGESGLAFVEGPWTIVDLPSLGALEIAQMTAWRRREMPSYAGTPVESGDLYVSRRDTPDGRAFYAIVNETAFATFLPYPQSDPALVAEFLESMRTHWEPDVEAAT